MRNNSQARSKLLMLLAILVLVLLIQGVVHVYRDMETHGAARKYASASVSYGTHYQATSMPPMVQSPSLRHTTVAVPMASSRTSHTVRHTPSVSSSMKIYTTSSAQVRTIGSGGGSGAGGGIATTNGVGSSRRGMTYSGASVAMPTLALAKPSMAADPSSVRYTTGPRRAPSYTGDPSDGDYAPDDKDSNIWWQYDGEDWVTVEVRVVDGKIYAWNGIDDWVLVTDKDQADPYVPVGPMPWLFMAVLAAGYICWKRRSSLGRLSVFSR